MRKQCSRQIIKIMHETNKRQWCGDPKYKRVKGGLTVSWQNIRFYMFYWYGYVSFKWRSLYLYLYKLNLYHWDCWKDKCVLLPSRILVHYLSIWSQACFLWQWNAFNVAAFVLVGRWNSLSLKREMNHLIIRCTLKQLCSIFVHIFCPQ